MWKCHRSTLSVCSCSASHAILWEHSKLSFTFDELIVKIVEYLSALHTFEIWFTNYRKRDLQDVTTTMIVRVISPGKVSKPLALKLNTGDPISVSSERLESLNIT